eukprot:CAMPEP_0196995542 /NCGR_PEP_ID=MMETSP1380-20130617/1623_1 /TAXON_ID=5936 /ORGANISM="Euplotes crassus, Strain CT5" /LENGTH=332 /DNA_ID=CAMNT_0042411217 /DNA_START=21 /DNA_END=1019 /DNA_ORIENTATION=-
MMKFNNIEPRTREERAALKDKEKIEDYRLKQRVGGYHKYVDNAQVSQPDPVSSHYLPEADRFDKDFASHDKKAREAEYQKKLEVIERKRVEKFERDLQRWKYMDQEEDREKNRIEYMNEHYQTGKKNKGGAAYNVISLDYDNSAEGQGLKRRDDDAKVRALVRSKNIDMRSNCGYNILTGDQRPGVHVPPHETYNPYEYNAAQNAGKDIVFGSAPVQDRVSRSRGGMGEGQAHPSPAQAYHPSAQAPSYQAPAPSYQAPEAAYQPPAPIPGGSRTGSRGSRGSRRGGVQLPIAQKDYSNFGGNEGAGIGGGYSQPMQAPAADFNGGAGTKFY